MNVDNNAICAVLETALAVYDEASRGTGRTSRAIERLSPGDTLVVEQECEARRLRRLLADGDVSVIAVGGDDLRRRLAGIRNIRLDHTLVLAMWRKSIRMLAQELDAIENASIRPPRRPPISYNTGKY